MATKQKSLAEVNGLEWEAFVELLGNVVEHNPLCAAAVYGCRPFSSVDALQASFVEFLDSLPTKVTMATKQKSLAEVNGLEWEAFVELLGNVVEHNPLCAAAVYGCRPFSSVDALQASFVEFLDSLPTKGKEGVLRLYPDLAGRLSVAGALTSESKEEHAAAGLDRISDADRRKMADFNGRYREKFGFPFVICARENRVQAILEGLERRLQNTKEQEASTGVNEVKKICNLRLRDLVVSAKI